MFIKYNKESYKNDSLEMYIYGILKTQVNQAGFTSISISQLLEYNNSGRSQAQKVKKALTNLLEQQVIAVYEGVDFLNTVELSNVRPSTILYFKVSEIVSDKEPFILIYTDEILRFMSQKMKGTKANIFKQFLYLMKFVNQGDNFRKISFPNISKIADETDVSDRSVKNYTKTLEEQGFLYSNILIMEKEKVKKIYSRPQHSQDVDDAIAECISNNTKKINTKKGNTQSVKTNTVQDVKEFKATMKKSELLFGLDKQIIDTFQRYEGELNDQALSKLKKYQEQHGAEVLLKAIHIAMDGKIGLKNPTGFMLRRLEDGDVITDAEYRIKRSKEQSEQMDREDSKMIHFDYKKALYEKKRNEQKRKEEVNYQGGHDRKLNPELVGVPIVEPKVEQLNQVELYPYRTIWQIEGFKSRDEYDKAKEKAEEEENMRMLLASVKTS